MKLKHDSYYAHNLGPQPVQVDVDADYFPPEPGDPTEVYRLEVLFKVHCPSNFVHDAIELVDQLFPELMCLDSFNDKEKNMFRLTIHFDPSDTDINKLQAAAARLADSLDCICPGLSQVRVLA